MTTMSIGAVGTILILTVVWFSPAAHSKSVDELLAEYVELLGSNEPLSQKNKNRIRIAKKKEILKAIPPNLADEMELALTDLKRKFTIMKTHESQPNSDIEDDNPQARAKENFDRALQNCRELAVETDPIKDERKERDNQQHPPVPAKRPRVATSVGLVPAKRPRVATSSVPSQSITELVVDYANFPPNAAIQQRMKKISEIVEAIPDHIKIDMKAALERLEDASVYMQSIAFANPQSILSVAAKKAFDLAFKHCMALAERADYLKRILNDLNSSLIDPRASAGGSSLPGSDPFGYVPHSSLTDPQASAGGSSLPGSGSTTQ